MKSIPNELEKGNFQTKHQHAFQETTLYFFDFETGPQGFLGIDGTDVGIKWHTSDEFWTYEGKAWWCGEKRGNEWGYDDLWYEVLDTPHDQPIDLTGVASPKLTMKARWTCEPPAEPESNYQSDWDGWTVWVSTNGGASFDEWLEPSGGYNCVHDTSWAYQMHGKFIPGGVPVFNDSSDSWVDVEFPLDTYIGQEVVLRIAFLSDQVLSTFGTQPFVRSDTSYHGLFIDNFSVDDDATNLFLDNADDKVHLTPDYLVRGNFWELTEDNSHSPTHSWHIDADDHWSLFSNWLETPWIELPSPKPPLGLGTDEGWFPYLSFYVYNDMPDFDGDGWEDMDIYLFEITADGVHWEQQAAHQPASGWDTTWALWRFNRWIKRRIFNCRGESVRFRWRVETDSDNNGGNGAGLFIDDVRVYATKIQDDIGISNIDISFPNSVDLPASVTV
ncbi:MAG: immune inhibitor A, partial [Thermoplasmata archaeon]